MLRAYRSDDTPDILALNAASVTVLSPMDAARFEHLRSLCSLLKVAEHHGDVAGFLMGFCDGTAYDSVNYRWFSANCQAFLYIDRVVVSSAHRGRGIASRFYEHAIDWSRERGLRALVAEIDIEPPNQASLQFHQRFGFCELDRLTHSPTKVVSLQRLEIN
jgi:predicted GNAT superfamily acetyltransferase